MLKLLTVLLHFVLASILLPDDLADTTFENSVRPVLIENCFRCHSEAKSSGGLRVDSREALLSGGESGPSIVPGNAHESLLLKAIQRHPDVSAMPPDKEKSLRPDQISAFRDWIQAGATWPLNSQKFSHQQHWAFGRVMPQVQPPVSKDTTLNSPIDPFVLSKLEAAGASIRIAADKRTLLRRATFDLIGLPPKPSEVDAFLDDNSPDAFMRVVDRLLASPQYGERWGRHWLDIVRYTDTAGETADYPLPLAWRYRNYVIDAFNEDKPYDEFLREQVAGDILAKQGPPDRYAERVIATGYLALSRRFGFDSENYQHLTIQDTIDTLGQSVLGLSLGCARCHDHKFDAISMKDYYGLYAIFDSSRYAFPGSEQKQKYRAMVPLVSEKESHAKWVAHDRLVASLIAKIEHAKLPVPSAILRSLNEIDGDFEMQAPAAGGSNGVLVSPWHYEGKISVTHSAQSPYRNLYHTGKVGVSVGAQAGKYQISQAVTSLVPKECDSFHFNMDFRISASGAEEQGAHWICLGSTPRLPALRISISSTAVSIERDGGWDCLAEILPNQWLNLQLCINLKNQTVSGAVRGPTQDSVFENRPLIASSNGRLNHLSIESADMEQKNAPGLEFDNIGIELEPISVISLKGPSQQLPEENDPSKTKSDGEEALAELKTLLTDGPYPMAYAMSEGTPHSVSMHMRGEPSQPGPLVPRGSIEVLSGGSLDTESIGSGRGELARWLTQANNPLTARVMVNRIWQLHFGRGLVVTPNDFGVRGVPPTHPELLDYLSAKFVTSGWSVKAMHRTIMLSSTYQQSSLTIVPKQGDLSLSSGQNSLAVNESTERYSHFTRRRLSAEEIRDSILAVCGELDLSSARGHPFPSPLQWGYTQHAPFTAVYEHSQRSVYLMTQRLKRHPFLSLFDGPDPNATTPDRLGTTVPTQALFFLNDPFVHARADAWARQLELQSTNASVQIDSAFRSAYSRHPTTEELSDAERFLCAYRNELANYAGTPEQTEGHNALSALLRTLLGSNEFLYVD